MKPLAPPPDWIAPYEPDPDAPPSRVAEWLGVVVDRVEVITYEVWEAARNGDLDAQNAVIAAVATAGLERWQAELDREAEARWPR